MTWCWWSCPMYTMMITRVIIKSAQIAEALGRRNPNVTNESFEFGKNRTEYRRMLEDVRKNINHLVNIQHSKWNKQREILKNLNLWASLWEPSSRLQNQLFLKGGQRGQSDCGLWSHCCSQVGRCLLWMILIKPTILYFNFEN